MLEGNELIMLDDLLKVLVLLRKKLGNVPVTYAGDDEGNSFDFVRFPAGEIDYMGEIDPYCSRLKVALDDEVDDPNVKTFKAVVIN